MAVDYSKLWKLLIDKEMTKIQEFIKCHYKEMYIKWSEYSQNGFYRQDR